MNRAVVPLLAVFVAIAVVVIATQPKALPPFPAPDVAHLAGGAFTYRPAGEFRLGTKIVDAPMQQIKAPALTVMKYQVSQADYAACMADKACPVVPTHGSSGHAQTGVNFADATAYARWFSGKTGQEWRLPTDAEWLRSAGDRGNVVQLDVADTGSDPSQRWLQSYRSEAKLRGDADFATYPLGHFGLNDLGVADIAGNIWEWTITCQQNGTLRADGQAIASMSDYCGVRSVQGKHRAYVIDFIRDARSGGCGAGVPPDYLGFRLVRDPDAS